MLRKFISWNWHSKAAAAVCLVPAAAPYAYGAMSTGVDGAAWWETLLLPAFVLLGVPFLAAPQLAMLFLTRLAKRDGLRLFLLGASLAMAAIFIWFIVTGDFTGSSTAAVAIVLYPLYLAGASLAAGLLLLWLFDSEQEGNE